MGVDVFPYMHTYPYGPSALTLWLYQYPYADFRLSLTCHDHALELRGRITCDGHLIRAFRRAVRAQTHKVFAVTLSAVFSSPPLQGAVIKTAGGGRGMSQVAGREI